MSFLDDSDESPRPSSARRPRGGGGGTATVDPQTLMVRRIVAGGGGLLVLLLLVFGVRGCLDARKERAFKDYVRDQNELVAESNQQSEALFGLMRDPGSSDISAEENVNGFRADAARFVDRAKDLDPPDDLKTAHRYFVDSLEFRRDGLGGVARELPGALVGENRGEATQKIAAQMQNFLASDVIYSQRVVPDLQGPLKKEGLLDSVQIPKSQYLPDIDWLRPRTVASNLRGGGGGASDEAAAPGLHGNGLGTVTVKPGGATLAEGQSTDIKLAENLAFDVQIANQGENEEKDVTVKVSLSSGGKPIDIEEQLDSIAAGETKTVSIPLADTPPIGRPVKINVSVEPVAGEQKTDNNKGSFTATFRR